MYPLHFAVLVVLVCLEVAKLVAQTWGNTSERAPFTNGDFYGALAANVLLIQGLHTLDGLSWNIPSWSISCEFFVYVVFGMLALIGLVRLPSFPYIAILIGGTIYCLLAAAFGNLDITYDWGGVRCFAGFFLGSSIVFIGSISRILPNGALKMVEIAVIVVAVTLMSLIGGSAVVLQTGKGPIARLLQSRYIKFLGRHSYSIYMVQLPIYMV